jgi:preprotein translocase subunit SecB
MSEPGAIEAVRRVARECELYDLRILGLTAKLLEEAPSVGTRLDAALDIGLNVQTNPEDFRVVGQFNLRVHDAERDDRQSFFSAGFKVVGYYRFTAGCSATEEELREFARLNGMLHLWPYFRTFVQQTCGQLSIPPIVLPPFRADHPFKVHFAQHGEAVPDAVLAQTSAPGPGPGA